MNKIFFRYGLYYKLHGSVRVIPTKSEAIRKHSRHDARGSDISDTPSTRPSAQDLSDLRARLHHAQLQ